MRCLLATMVVAAVAACGPQAPKDELPFPAAGPGTAAPDPAAMGPFPVGVHTTVYEDSARRKPDGSPRQLVTEIWYPAVQSVRGQPGVSYDIRSLLTDEQRAMSVNAVVPLLETPAVRDAEMATSHGPFPVVIFSHGHGGVRWQSTFYTVLLASHGYVVISPDHEGDTLSDILRGQLEEVTQGLEKRPVDILLLLSRLERMRSDDFLFGKVDLERIGMSGHSFGALTSLRVAAMDGQHRLKVIVPQTPTGTSVAWLGLPMPVKLGIPVMIQGAGEDQTLDWPENGQEAWEAQQPPRYLLKLITAGHFTYSDICQFDLPSLADQVMLNVKGANIRKVLGDGCGPTAPKTSVSFPLINHFAVGLFNAVLRGNDASRALLSQAEADRIGAGVAEAIADP